MKRVTAATMVPMLGTNHDFGRWGSKREFDPPCAQFIKKKPGIEPPGANAPLPPKVERVGRAGVARVAAREKNLQGKQRRQLGVDEGLLVLEQVKVKAGKGHQSKKKANSVEAEIALSFVVARELQRWRARFC